MKMPDIALPPGVTARFGENPQQVAEELADTVADALRRRLAEAAEATLVVSGGSTPRPFFAALSRKELDWARVIVTLADERWVDEPDPASNAWLVKSSLLRNRAAAACFLPLKQEGETPAQGLDAVKAGLARLRTPVDVLVLGMGSDGHTASWFPDAPELSVAMDPACPDPVAAMTPPSQDRARITLTWPVLCNARFTALHIKGADKLVTLRTALAHPAELSAMPVRAFLKAGLQIFWSP